MKRALLIVIIGAALIGVASLTGCCAHTNNCNCPSSDGTTGGLFSHCPIGQGIMACGGQGCPACQQNCPGPGTAPVQGAVSYPYYTVHGPRDYFAPAPPSIGP